MIPFDSNSMSSSGSSSSCPGKSPAQVDGLLAGAGYSVRSSELRDIADRLERLETVMVNAPPLDVTHLNDAVYHNPSDLSTWVDSILSELNQAPQPDIPEFSDLNHADLSFVRPIDDRPENKSHAPPVRTIPAPVVSTTPTTEEDLGIRLVHTLMNCAESVGRDQFSFAASLIDEMQVLLTRVGTCSGIGKVAGYFIDALSRRLFTPLRSGSISSSAYENEILYHNFYEATPYLKFAHFTANQAILEAFNGHDSVHVIDFNLMQGLQWPPLIQALALRSGGPPMLRLTGIGPPSPDGRDLLREIGLQLADLARSVNVRFAFRGIAASRLEEVKPWMLQINPKEALAVNSIMQLHRLLAADPIRGGAPIGNVLGWIRNLNPKIITMVEQEVNHNHPRFLQRFSEALYYYSTLFDSLEVCAAQREKALAKMYVQREICNVVCCEGLARVERHEPFAKWKARLGEAGFIQLHLGSDAFKQASMLLSLSSAEGYCVQESDGCLTLGWHSRPLIAASAWQVVNPQFFKPRPAAEQ